MARPLLPDDLWSEIAPLLPPPRPRPKGGRPPIGNRAALTGILFVLRSGLPWEMLPAEMGCGSGMSCWRRLRDWQRPACGHGCIRFCWSASTRPVRSTGVGQAWTVPPSRPKRGACHRPEPDGSGKPGTKRHLVTDARGTPLGLRLTGANRHDSPQMASTLDAIPPLRTGRRGRPRRRPDKLHADKAYEAKARRQECRARGIVPRIARKGIESSEKLGRHRWVVSAPTLGSTASAACPSATSAAPTSTRPSQASRPASSLSTRSTGSVRRSKTSSSARE